MSTNAPSRIVVYPEDDGLPMSENTDQFDWITKLVGGIGLLFRADPNVFVAGDLLWYPIEGDNTTRVAPDVMVVFGRPKGYRGSYQQWVEDGIAPQVVFEILSPGNRSGERAAKLAFYEMFDVEEYYEIAPKAGTVEGWYRVGDNLQSIAETHGWESPRLGVRFDTHDFPLTVLASDGRSLETYVNLGNRAEKAEHRAEAERRRADLLAEKRRALGIDPDA